MNKRPLTRTLSRVASAVCISAALVCTSVSTAHANTYEEAVQLSWDARNFAASTSLSFFDTPVAVPGDTATRTLQVRNDGPTDGVLTARIVQVALNTPDAADVHHNRAHQAPDQSGLYGGAGDQGNVYDDLHVSWADGTASFSTLYENVTTEIARIPIAQGETVPVTLGYEFALASTAGNQSNVDLRQASLGVELSISGDTTPPSDPPPVTDPPPITPPVTDPPPGEDLPTTGGDTAQGFWWIAAALIGLGGGTLLARARNRNRIRRTGRGTEPTA